MILRLLRLVVLVVALLGVRIGVARAETLEAPVGGAPIPLGDGRVPCAKATGGWTVDDVARAVRPPADESAIGTVVTLRVAPSAAECARAPVEITLAATARWPTPNSGAWTLALDEGRLVGRGRALARTAVSWPSGDALESSTCRDPAKDGDVDVCTWAVPKTLSADPRQSALRWWPGGALVTSGAVLYDGSGKRVPPEAFAITPSRIEVTALLPPNPSVDVSSGVGRLALRHPEVVAGVECAKARCTANGGVLEVQAPPATLNAIDVQLRLAAHVVYPQSPDKPPVVRVAILRCPMDVASGPPLRGVDGKVVVKLDGACAQDPSSLSFLVDTRRADVERVVTLSDAAYVVLAPGELRGQEISVMAVRNSADGAVVAVARTSTREVPVVRTTLEIPGRPPIDFIPRNRRAVVHIPRLGAGLLALRSVPNVYEASTADGVTTVQGDVNAAGSVALELGYRWPKLPPPLDTLDLAVLTDALQRSVKELNLPAPLGPLTEVVCNGEDGKPVRALPGVPLRVPFAARVGCKFVLHRERLSAEYGTQKLSLEIEVDKLDLTPRADAHVTKTLVVRPGAEPLVAWIKGVSAPYDRVVVRVSHVADEAHYLGALELISDEPAEQWAIAFVGGRVRIYATTVIPTGLYRVAVGANTGSSGALTISLGALARLTWLDRSGKEGLLGFETGVLALGLTGDTSPSTGASLFQIGAVAGLGLSLPLANAGQPAQASINLHVWFEQLLSKSGGSEPLSEQALIFGPSLSLGNVGASF